MGLLVADRIQRLELFDGEDASDLLRVIQESFGIEFTTDELAGSETVSQLSECISKRLTPSERCLSAVVFYRLRRAFIDLFKSSRAMIRPDASLSELLPWIDRRKRWRDLQARSGLALPRLVWPVWLACAALLISIAVAWAYAIWLGNFSAGGLATCAVGLLAFFFLARLLNPLARTLPRSCRSFGDLAKVTLARNYAKVSAEAGGSSPKELLSALRQLIAIEIGQSIEKITGETRFPEGLNIH